MRRLRNVGREGLDAALEFSVVGSFSNVGALIRPRLFHWPSFDPRCFVGRVVVVSGANAGLGLETATQLARLKASVVLLVRDAQRGEAARRQIVAATGNDDIRVVLCDLGDLDSVRRAALALRALPALHGLVHNAGAMSKNYRVSAQGLELTTAVQLVGPFLLTNLLLEQLRSGAARVVWVTSGGMYAQPLDVDWLESPEANYRGAAAYAKVKRAQVSLCETWAPSLAALGITMTAMHPGWVDTPGVSQSLPNFHRFMAKLLRTPAQGADTIIWLLGAPSESTPPGTLWLDRRARSLHRLARTRRSDGAAERRRLLMFCQSRSESRDGIEPGALP